MNYLRYIFCQNSRSAGSRKLDCRLCATKIPVNTDHGTRVIINVHAFKNTRDNKKRKERDGKSSCTEETTKAIGRFKKLRWLLVLALSRPAAFGARSPCSACLLYPMYVGIYKSIPFDFDIMCLSRVSPSQIRKEKSKESPLCRYSKVKRVKMM